jgi:hypothetical protein
MAFGTIRADVIQGTATTISLATAGQYNFNGNILPDVDNSRNLGSPLLRFANIYTGDLHLANDRGDWTVVEESEYLSLRNNKTGKTFKLVMEEVDS